MQAEAHCDVPPFTPALRPAYVAEADPGEYRTPFENLSRQGVGGGVAKSVEAWVKRLFPPSRHVVSPEAGQKATPTNQSGPAYAKIELPLAFLEAHREVRTRFVSELKTKIEEKGVKTAADLDGPTKDLLAKAALSELNQKGFQEKVLAFEVLVDKASPTRYFDCLVLIGRAVAKSEGGVLQQPMKYDKSLHSKLLPVKPENKLVPVVGYVPRFPFIPKTGNLNGMIVAGPYAYKAWPGEMRQFVLTGAESERERLSFFVADTKKHARGIGYTEWLERNNEGLADTPRFKIDGVITIEEIAANAVGQEIGKLLREPGTKYEKFSDKEFYKEKLKLSQQEQRVIDAQITMQSLHQRYPDQRMPDGTPVNDGVWNRGPAAAEYIRCLKEKYGADYVAQFSPGDGHAGTLDPADLLQHIADEAESALAKKSKPPP